MGSTVRHRLLVAYDVRDPARLRKTYQTLLGYGDPLQYSVFLCDLSPTEQALMETAVLRVIRPSLDSVLVVDLGPSTGRAARRIRALGAQALPFRRSFHLV